MTKVIKLLTKPERERRREHLRKAVRYFYDLQRLRIANSHRSREKDPESKMPEIELDAEGILFFERGGIALKKLETEALSEVKRLLKGVPIYESYLKDVKGIGPTLAGILVAEIDISRANTVSALWRYCGLGVDITTGQKERLKKGEKAHFNTFLKTKCFLIGESFIKCGSDWRKTYDGYKHRKQTMDPPWGKSDGHRHIASLRYMVKMFLIELWTTWRELEGLPVREPYSVGKLGMAPHSVSKP